MEASTSSTEAFTTSRGVALSSTTSIELVEASVTLFEPFASSTNFFTDFRGSSHNFFGRVLHVYIYTDSAGDRPVGFLYH